MKSRIRTTLESMKKAAPRATALALAIGVLTSIGATPAYAGAPLVKAAAPGYYRVMLGDFEVTALSDGTVALPVDKLLTNTTPEKTMKSLAKNHLSSPNPLHRYQLTPACYRY